MTNKQNDGGPAFPFDWMDFQPTTGQQVVREQFPGMSLRDWFAGQAMTTMRLGEYDSSGIAEDAYRLADAMLAERERGMK